MELTVKKDYNKCEKSGIRAETNISGIYVVQEENPYVNTTIGICKTVTDKHESHTYEDIKRTNFSASDFKIEKRGYFTGCKQYINVILFSLIGVLFAAVLAITIAVAIALPKGRGINGGWSNWGFWSQCSATCDFGTAHRERNCSNPIPENGGLFCSGNPYELQLCNQTICPAINGGWSDWSTWGTCSATCGTGLQSRTRTCTNPAPEPRGRPCVGDFSDHQLCDSTACQGTGIGFSVWGPLIDSPVKFSGVIYNYNNAYNTTNGEFVCTTRGLYYFQATLIAKITVDRVSYCILYKNNDSKYVFYNYYSSIYPQASGSVLLDLLPGDRIYISGCSNVAVLTSYSYFSGFLIKTV